MKPYYEQDGITIYNCRWQDTIENLMGMDLLLVDPPYGIGASRRAGFGNGVTGVYKTGFLKGKTRLLATEYKEGDWDDKPPENSDIQLMRTLSRHQMIFGGNYFDLPPSRCWLIWDKLNDGTCFADAEMIWTNLDAAVRVHRYLWNGMMKQHPEERYHPTQKPLALMKWCISQAPNTVKTVLDTYCGSGTTLVAAKAAGLSAVGVEIDEEYCEIAAMRLSQSVLDFSDQVESKEISQEVFDNFA